MHMEIVNPLDRTNRDIKTPLQRMEASDDPIESMRGRMLLELVRRLEDRPGPRTLGNLIMKELLLHAVGSQSSTTVMVGVDWPDHGAIRDGLPVSHYRVSLKHPQNALSKETRSSSAEEVARTVLMALIENVDD